MSDPCQNLIFLSISISTTNNSLTLDPAKTAQLVENFMCSLTKTQKSKKQRETLAGHLNWACNVIPYGRAYMVRATKPFGTSKPPTSKLKLPTASELEWWLMQYGVTSVTVTLLTDASQLGNGGFCY